MGLFGRLSGGRGGGSPRQVSRAQQSCPATGLVVASPLGAQLPPAVRLPHLPAGSQRPSCFTHAEPQGQANRLTPAWLRLSSGHPLGAGSPSVRESLCAGAHSALWGRRLTLARMHTDTHTHTRTHRGSQTHTPRHMRPGGWGNGRTLQHLVLGRCGSREPLGWHPTLTRVLGGAQPSQVWGLGHRPFLFSLYRLSLPTRHPQTHFI